MKFIHLILIALLFLFNEGCENSISNSDQLIDKKSENIINLLPMALGNKWTYLDLSIQDISGNYIDSIVVEIVDTATINNQTWYKFSTEKKRTNLTSQITSNHWKRIDSIGVVYTLVDSVSKVWLDPFVETYTFPFNSNNDNQFVVTVKENQTYSYLDSLYDDGIEFQFDVAYIDDEEETYTFSNNIGIINITNGWVGYKLVQYYLN